MGFTGDADREVPGRFPYPPRFCPVPDFARADVVVVSEEPKEDEEVDEVEEVKLFSGVEECFGCDGGGVLLRDIAKGRSGSDDRPCESD